MMQKAAERFGMRLTKPFPLLTTIPQSRSLKSLAQVSSKVLLEIQTHGVLAERKEGIG